jgi:hypothetical protein
LAPIAAPKSAPDRSRALANLQCYFAAMNFSADPLGDGDILRIVDVLCMA